MKRDLKSNKNERKSFGKKRAGNSNFRSINNFPTIDKVPNDNLYKNDNIYAINRNFEFSQNEEQSFRLFFYYQYQINGIKKILILFYLRFCFSKINNLYDLFSFFKIINLKNIFHIISFVISFILSNDHYLKQGIYNVLIYYLLSFNQCMNIYSIYYKLEPKYEHYLSLTSECLFNFGFLFFINIKLKYIAFPQIVILLVYFYSMKIFSLLTLLLLCPIGPIFAVLVYVLLKKSIREIWALFDSFKRSYYNINQGILESDPNPLFIISKDKNILYRNSVASKLINNILENPLGSARKMNRVKDDRFNTMNFLDIVHPNLKELFKKLLNDVMDDDKVSSFNFPLCKINNQQNINLDISNAYDIFDEKNYLYFVWFRIILSKTEWKNKTAYYMSFFPCEDVLLNEIFYQYTKRFSERVEKVISNSDIICQALINKKEKNNNNNIEQSPSSSINSDNKSSNSQDSQENNHENGLKNQKSGVKKNIYQLLIDNADNVDLNNTILFFFKNQVELLYDYSLTIELYFNMLYKQRNFKHCFENLKPNLKKRIKLRDLRAYYLEYFYDFTKEHKYKLEFKGDDEKNIFDIFIEENYLRIIMFNIIIFMICYLDDRIEPSFENRKEIVIKIIPELKDETPITPESMRANDEQYDKTPKGFSDSDKSVKKGELSFIFESFSTKGDLNKIQELINQRNKCGYHIKSEIIKLNYLDVGILAVNYLLQNYYKTNLEMSNKEGEQLIQFKLPCDVDVLTGSNNSRRYNQENITPESNSFFTSPLMAPKKNINKPKNFYNYNQNYNKKVLNIFYGIEKSPEMRSRHKRAVPSFTKYTEIGNKNRRCSRHLSQNLKRYIENPKNNNNETTDSNEIKLNFDDYDDDDKKEKEKNIKNSKKFINKFSFKQTDFSFDSVQGSFKSERIENEDISKDEEGKINTEVTDEKNENEDKGEKKQDQVLIIETTNNKDLISFLNNENKGEYILKVVNDVGEVEKELKNNEGKCNYKILLINMGNNKEIKYAESICENKGESLIYGYHFGAHTRSREKNNVKFDKRFDLSFSYEGIVYALKQVFINNKSIIK